MKVFHARHAAVRLAIPILFAALGAMASCSVPEVDYEGKLCDDSSPCPEGFYCSELKVCRTGTGAADGGSGGDGGADCKDITSDTFNCGACGNVCAPPKGGGQPACNLGKCTAACPSGTWLCGSDEAKGGGACTDFKDVEHCGDCDKVCLPPEAGVASCEAGRCKSVCNGTTLCGEGEMGGGKCVDLTYDAHNCGECGRTCEPPIGGNPGCSAAMCTGMCNDEGYVVCGGTPKNGGGTCTTVTACKAEPYPDGDLNTLILDHFDGANVAKDALAYVEDNQPCKPTAKSATLPVYDYDLSLNRFNQALVLSSPSDSAGSASFLRYDKPMLVPSLGQAAEGTVEMWVNLSRLPDRDTRLVAQAKPYGYGPTTGNCAIAAFELLVKSDGTLLGKGRGSNPNVPAFLVDSGSTKLKPNTWTHVALTWTTAFARIYVNGKPVADKAPTGPVTSGYAGEAIDLTGATGGGSDAEPMKVLVDEFRVSKVFRTSYNAL